MHAADGPCSYRAPFFPLLKRGACLLFLSAALSVAAIGCADSVEGLEEGIADTSGALTGGERVRVVAGNLTSGKSPSYTNGPAGRILSALAPDVAVLQEFRAHKGEDLADLEAFVAQTFGPEYHLYREPDRGIPNGIVTRYPILEAGEWDDREVLDRNFVWARLDIPGDRDLVAVSVHLLTSSPAARASQAEALVTALRSYLRPDDFLVIGGDLNTRSFGERALRVLSELVSSRRTPVDDHGVPYTNRNRNRPYDWVLPSPDLEEVATAVPLGDQSYDDGLVFDTRVANDDTMGPARPADSVAPNMQHMPVIKDFLIPTAAP